MSSLLFGNNRYKVWCSFAVLTAVQPGAQKYCSSAKICSCIFAVAKKKPTKKGGQQEAATPFR
jgi:hypothetical protein